MCRAEYAAVCQQHAGAWSAAGAIAHSAAILVDGSAPVPFHLLSVIPMTEYGMYLISLLKRATFF